jgi:diguanylate cyclase (GGDEF)-like protein
MTQFNPALSPSEPDTTLLDRLALLKRACLGVVASVVFVAVATWLIPALCRSLPGEWNLMRVDSVFAALCIALSLHLSEPRHSQRMQRIGILLALLVAVLAATVLFEYKFQFFFRDNELFLFDHGSQPSVKLRMSPPSAIGFALLGFSTALIWVRKRIAVRVADLIIFCLLLYVMVMASGYIFNAMSMFGLSESPPTSPQTLLCLSLLTIVAALRRAENGAFAIFLGPGIGSRIARILSPVVLVLPFLRETARAHFINAGRLPPQYATAILASLAAMISLSLMVFLAWRINGMEKEIRDLSLRDELTGLYNRKGFYLLAEHALRLAHRSSLPFSVLFIDLDNLKHTNDSLGHQAGSEFLIETGEIIKITFRDSDVMGRIGGDEFAVAGQFSQMAIALAAKRLQDFCALQNAGTRRSMALSFSVGHVTSDSNRREPLDELLAKADQAMYQEKRRKKVEVN